MERSLLVISNCRLEVLERRNPDVKAPLDFRGTSVVRYVNDASSEIHLSSTDLVPCSQPKLKLEEFETVCGKSETGLGKIFHDPEMDPAIEEAISDKCRTSA
jgi:hypothetical protein